MSSQQPYGAYNQPTSYPGGNTPGSATNVNQWPYPTNQNDKYQTYGQPTTYVYATKP